MSAVSILWKGHCREPRARYRLLSYLHRLAVRSDGYLRQNERPALSVVGEAGAPRPNIQVFDEVRTGPVRVSSAIGLHPETFLTRAGEAGLETTGDGDAASVVVEQVRLRGIDFKLFDPRAMFPKHDRMSFVFLECPEHHFLDGRLVAFEETGEGLTLGAPSLQLDTYLDDWTDCLFAWIRFFLMGDFWWQRGEELQGYADYRGVFEELQTARGTAEAEEATFDAVLSTFSQHAEHWIDEVNRRPHVSEG